MSLLYDLIKEQVKNIETDNLSDDVDQTVSLEESEKQKTYFWVRVYLKDELKDVVPGDDFEICYSPSGEKTTLKFIAFGKKNLNRDLDTLVVANYEPEDNPKCLCLMVDEDEMKSDSIPFIRTLFKTSPYFEFQVYRREQLVFTNMRTKEVCVYIDCDF